MKQTPLPARAKGPAKAASRQGIGWFPFKMRTAPLLILRKDSR